jgi:4-coumarate--CoA ligase
MEIFGDRSASTHILPPELSVKKVGSVGLLLPNQEARLVDDDENDVTPGERGELWIRGPNIMKYADVHPYKNTV